MGKCVIKVRIYCLLYLNLALFYRLCDFPQIVQSDAIWGQLCEVAPLHNIRWPGFPFLHQLTLTSQMLNMSRPLNHLLSIKMANQFCVAWRKDSLFPLIRVLFKRLPGNTMVITDRNVSKKLKRPTLWLAFAYLF